MVPGSLAPPTDGMNCLARGRDRSNTITEREDLKQPPQRVSVMEPAAEQSSGSAGTAAFPGETSPVTVYISSLLPVWESLASEEPPDPVVSTSLFPVAELPAHTLTTQPPYLRYKTELCSRYTENGTCSYDDRCQFAHGLHELRVPSQHPKYKTELCRSFHSLGFCPYGLRCLFIHSPEERRPPRPIRPPHLSSTRKRGGPCRMFFSQGGCPYGSRCHFIHGTDESLFDALAVGTKPRKTLCRTFESLGICPYGSRCHFLHKTSEAAEASDLAELPSPLLVPYRHHLGPSSLSSPQPTDGSLSPASDEVSSSLGTPDLYEGSTSPVLQELSANNAFTFSSLLLPLALRLQGLHCSREPDLPIWGRGEIAVHRVDLSVKH